MSHTAPDGKPATWGEDQSKSESCDKCKDVMAEDYHYHRDKTLCARCYHEVTKDEQ